MPRDMQRWGFPPTTVSYCELQTLRRNSALAPSAERPGRLEVRALRSFSFACYVPIALLDVNDTRTSDLLRGRRVL